MQVETRRFSYGTWIVWAVICAGAFVLVHRLAGTLTPQNAKMDALTGFPAGFAMAWTGPLREDR